MRLIKALLAAGQPYKPGDFIKTTKIIRQFDVDKFSEVSGDHNPIHKTGSSTTKPLVHGAFLNSIMSGIIGTQLPGTGTMVLSQSFSFPTKCYVDDPIDFYVELLEVRKILKIKYQCIQNDNIVFDGEAKLMMMPK